MTPPIKIHDRPCPAWLADAVYISVITRDSMHIASIIKPAEIPNRIAHAAGCATPEQMDQDYLADILDSIVDLDDWQYLDDCAEPCVWEWLIFDTATEEETTLTLYRHTP
jgi:hypothetical protein